MGHTILVTGNGLRAVEAAGVQNFDLILMDLQMPEMDGFEATARIRQAESALGPPHSDHRHDRSCHARRPRKLSPLRV